MSNTVQYVQHGLALLPIPPGRKGPSATGWNLPENAIVDPARAAGIMGNVGLAHAYCTPTPTAALDIDDMEKASEWLCARGILLASLLDGADAVQILSGRPGRAKLLYRLPGGMSPMVTKQASDPVSGEMILELRCAAANGRTVQDVLPPSIHPDTGLPYQWGGKGDWRSLPFIPEPLLEVWRSISQPMGSECGTSHSGKMSKAVDDTPRQRAIVAELLGRISADCSYPTYRDIVWAVLSLGWHDGVEIARDWCVTAPNRFDEASFATIVDSYDSALSPTLGTIHFYARNGGAHE